LTRVSFALDLALGYSQHGFGQWSAGHWTWLWTVGGLALDLALDSGRLCIGLGFGLESALHWTWLWTGVSFALDLALDYSQLGIGLESGWLGTWLWTRVSFAFGLESG